VGNRDRGDDGVGPTVVARVRERLTGGTFAPTGVSPDRSVSSLRIIECADPADLVDLWDGTRLAVVVDAVRGADGEPPGTVIVLRTGAARPPLPGRPWGGTGPGGTHALGLAEAVELARALGRIPEDLVVVGVMVGAAPEGTGGVFRPGAGLSPEVVASVDVAADVVLRELGDAVP
jgi:hydrogenase maturation protease